MFGLSGNSRSSPPIYGLTCKTRCINAQLAEHNKTRFLVGTLSLKEENEIHLIEYREEENDIKCVYIYNHHNEIWSLSPCPIDPSLFFTASNSSNNIFRASLWKMKDDDPTLEEVFELPGHTGEIKSLLWNPSEKSLESAISLDDNQIHYWKIDQSTAKQASVMSIGPKYKFLAVSWNPLHNEQNSNLK